MQNFRNAFAEHVWWHNDVVDLEELQFAGPMAIDRLPTLATGAHAQDYLAVWWRKR